MRFALYLNPQGNIAAQSHEIARGSKRHHWFHAYWKPTAPTQRCLTYRQAVSLTDGVIADRSTRPEDYITDWNINGYEHVCDVESPGDANEHALHELALKMVVARFDVGREVAAPSFQIKTVLKPMWDFMDRHQGRTPLPKIKLLTGTPKKSKHDFTRW